MILQNYLLIYDIHMNKKNNKRITMNKLTKIGASALAGSLAMVSAHSTEYVMSGGMTATFTTQDAPSQVQAKNGKGFGFATDLGFTANGELDNGYTVKAFMSVDTNAALANTSSQLTLGMGSLGTLQLNNIGGSKANGIDDVTPNAYNETWDGLNPDNGSFFGSLTSSGSLDYRIPAQEYMGNTVNASITFDPNANTGAASKGGVANTSISGTAYTVQVANENGVEVGFGVESVDDEQGKVGTKGSEQSTAYIKYAFGAVSVGYQEAVSTIAKTAKKDATFASIAYTMGDLTVSYGESDIKTNAHGATASLLTIDQTSIQAAYTMGAMTLSAAMSETDNVAGATGKHDQTTLAVSFAF